jgi:hypothetical protein
VPSARPSTHAVQSQPKSSHQHVVTIDKKLRVEHDHRRCS